MSPVQGKKEHTEDDDYGCFKNLLLPVPAQDNIYKAGQTANKKTFFSGLNGP